MWSEACLCFRWELPGAGAVLTPPAAVQGPIRPCCTVSVAAVRTVAHRLVILLQVEQWGCSPSGAGVLPQGETSPGRLLTYLACSPCGKGRTVLRSNLLVPDFQNREPVPYHPFEMGPTASVSAITTLVHFRCSARKHQICCFCLRSVTSTASHWACESRAGHPCCLFSRENRWETPY